MESSQIYRIRLSDPYWAQLYESAVLGQEIQKHVGVVAGIVAAWFRGYSVEQTCEALSATTEEKNDAMDIIGSAAHFPTARRRRL